MTINYTPSLNLHTLNGATEALRRLLPRLRAASLLDVGCGTGTWLRAASDLGLRDLLGVDGCAQETTARCVPAEWVRAHDLNAPLNLGRRFDLALCLEVAEHLPAAAASGLITLLTRHADQVLFSAACPGQAGQNHVNCRWPDYWQQLFNRAGFACHDWPRWELWEIQDIEPWYRQNMFLARRDPDSAGGEPRIASVLHPELMSLSHWQGDRDLARQRVEEGLEPVAWHLRAFCLGLSRKVLRRMRRRSARAS